MSLSFHKTLGKRGETGIFRFMDQGDGTLRKLPFTCILLFALIGCNSAPTAQSVGPSGIALYAQQVHDLMQQNQIVTVAEQKSGRSGIVYIRAVLAPDGSLQSVGIAKSSGIAELDQSAMDNVTLMNFPPFNTDMPQKPTSFVVPIVITGNTGG